MQRLVNSWLSYGMIGVMILAAIIMWTTIGRTIVDGRDTKQPSFALLVSSVLT